MSCGITTFSSVQRADRRFELLARDRWWLGAPVLEIGFARARASLPAAAPGRNAGVRAQRSGGSRRSAAAAVPRLPLGSRAGSLRLVEEGRVHVDSRADRLKGARLSPTWERTARSFRVRARPNSVVSRGFWHHLLARVRAGRKVAYRLAHSPTSLIAAVFPNQKKLSAGASPVDCSFAKHTRSPCSCSTRCWLAWLPGLPR